MRSYCTYFDSNYFDRGLALHASMMKHCQPFQLHIMALDELADRWLQALELPQVVHFPIDDILDNELLEASENRNRVEFIWTCTPSFIIHVRSLTRGRRTSLVYLDADTYFFSDPAPLYREMRIPFSRWIGLTPHRFPPKLAWRILKNGTYNLGLAYFDSGPEAFRALCQWKKQCLEWCGQTYMDQEHKCGDQGYLDTWPEEFGADDIIHPGVNLGPWNQMQYCYLRDESQLYIYHDFKAKPIILYHFHAWNPENESGYPLHPWVKEVLYTEYAEVMAGTGKKVEDLRAASQA